jgi:hypothetical protein
LSGADHAGIETLFILYLVHVFLGFGVDAFDGLIVPMPTLPLLLTYGA